MWIKSLTFIDGFANICPIVSGLPFRNPYSLTARTFIMAGATDKAVIQDANEAALREFKEGVKRSIRQADAGLVKTFKTKEEFLDHLKNLE